MSEALTRLLTLQPVRLVVCWVWRSYHVRTTSDVSPVTREQNPSCHERSWPWGSVFVMRVDFLDVRWDAVPSMLCLASSWLLQVISYNTVVSRPYKPTGWFYLHRRPGGTKPQAGMAKQAGLPLNPTEWGGKHKLTSPLQTLRHILLFHSKTACASSRKNEESMGKHLDLNWLTVQSGILVPLIFVQAEHDGVSLDNFPPACFEYQMESFSWLTGMVPNFAGAFTPEFCCFCNYLGRIIQAWSRLAQGKCWATQHESTLHMST